MTAEQKKGAKNLGLTGASLGVGGLFGMVLASLLKSRPDQFIGLLNSFGPVFLLVVAGLWLVDRHAPPFIQAQRENAAATQKLADSVQAIAQKDDRQTERLAREISFVGSQMEKLLTGVDELRRGQERSRGASA
jgi:hypothetical protein